MCNVQLDGANDQIVPNGVYVRNGLSPSIMTFVTSWLFSIEGTSDLVDLNSHSGYFKVK